jgi:hypothetical protein
MSAVSTPSILLDQAQLRAAMGCPPPASSNEKYSMHMMTLSRHPSQSFSECDYPAVDIFESGRNQNGVVGFEDNKHGVARNVELSPMTSLLLPNMGAPPTYYRTWACRYHFMQVLMYASTYDTKQGMK